MTATSRRKLTRRQFAGTLTAALAAPALLAPRSAAQEEEKKPAAAQSEEEWLNKAAAELREFKVPEGAEPAFAFKADWNHR